MSKINLEENHRRGEPGLGRQSWTDATRVAKVKRKWRGLVKGPILLKERRKKVSSHGISYTILNNQ